MPTIEVDVDQVLEELREICKKSREMDDDTAHDNLMMIIGALWVLGLDLRDLCWGCSGCDNPFYITKKMAIEQGIPIGEVKVHYDPDIGFVQPLSRGSI